MLTFRALFLLTLLAICARGQSMFTLASGHPKTSTIGGPRAVALTDCNGDRKPDAVIAGDGYQLFYSDAAGGSLALTATGGAALLNADAVVSTDFNGDGVPDIAVRAGHVLDAYVGAGFLPPGVHVFTGRVTGGSCSYSHVTTLNTPFSGYAVGMVGADFNRDGKVDLATTTGMTKQLLVFMSDGDGTFRPPVVYDNIGEYDATMAGADFDGDGNFDLAIANWDGSVRIFKGDGTGAFTRLAGDNPTGRMGRKYVAAADFNADGKPDLAVANNGWDSFSILLGNGDGTFTGLHTGDGSYELGYTPVAVTTGDFDGDGRPDLAFANEDAIGSVSVWRGIGGGDFSQIPGSPFAAGGVVPRAGSTAIAVGDLNGDTRPDLWVVGTGGLSVLENQWPSIVAPAELELHTTAGRSPASLPAPLSGAPGPYTVRTSASWLAATISGATVRVGSASPAMAPGRYSGTVWVTAPNAYGAAIRVTLTIAAPSGTLVEAPGSPITDIGEIPYLADVDLDGKLDLLFTGYPGVGGLNHLRVLLGDGTGAFAPPPGGGTVAVTNPTLMTLADFNGDGRPDAAITSYQSCALRIYLGDGAGGFRGAVSYPGSAGFCPQGIVAADWNLDGKMDLAVEDQGSYSIFLGNGDGTFTATAWQNTGSCSAPFPAAADFNLDGKPDLAFSDSCATPRVTIRYGDGRGGFPTSVSFAKRAGGIFPAFAGDFNGDGKPDLAVGNSQESELFLSNSGATFENTRWLLPSPRSLTGADMDGDGNLDLIGASSTYVDDSLMVSCRYGPIALTAFHLPAQQHIAVGDLNGDGRADVVAYRYGATSNQLRVLLGAKTSSTTTLTAGVSSPSVAGQPVTLRATVAGLPGPDWCGAWCSASFTLASGTVTFKDGATVLGTAPLAIEDIHGVLSATATFTTSALASATHNLSVEYTGDARTEPSSGALAYEVCPKLSFPPPPGSVGANTPFDLRVEIVNFTGGVLGSYNVPVTLTLTGPGVFPSGGNTRTVAAVNGVATFTGLSLGTPGAYTMTATAAGIISGSTTLIIQSHPLTLNPAALSFQAVCGGPAPAAQTVSVSIPAGAASYTAAASQPWIVAPASGTLPGTLNVSVETAGLQPGNYTGAITVTPGTGYDPATIPVTLTVAAPTDVTAQPATLAFQAVFGRPAPAAQTVSVSIPAGTASYAAAGSQPWIAVAPASGTLPGVLNLSVETAGLQPGGYSGVVTVTPEAGYNPATIAVTLTVVPPNNVTAQPAALAVSVVRWASDRLHTVQLSSAAPVTCSVAASATWLRAAPSVNVPGPLVINVAAGDLNRGAYSGTITLTCAGAHNSPVAIPVTLNVVAAQSLIAQPEELRFQYEIAGPLPAVQQVYVDDAGGGTPAIAPVPSAAWLKTAVVSQTSTAHVRVWVDPARLAPGTYMGSVFIAPGLEVPVTLVVTPQPRLTARAAELAFSAMAGGENPPEQILYFTAGGRPVKFTLKLTGAWLRVGVVNGSTLAPANLRVRADVSGLAAGTYRGTIEITAPEAVNSPLVIPVLLMVDAQAPVFSAVGIVNAASLQTGPVASGEMVRLKGTHLACNSVPEIVVDGQRVKATAANADGITWIVPPSVVGKTEVSVMVSCNGVTSAAVKVPVAEAMPGIFTIDGAGSGQADVLNQDYNANGAAKPAARGSVVMFFGTGFGATRPGEDRLERLLQPVTATIGEMPAEVVWAGSAPGKPGVQQINIRIPKGCPTGPYVAAMIYAGKSQTQAGVTLAVQ